MKKKEYKKLKEKEKLDLKTFKDKNEGVNLKTFLIITGCVIAFVFLVFLFTKIKTGEWNLFTRNNNVTYVANAQTTKILCGGILNRKDSEYFVLAYEMKEDNASLYDSILSRYNLGKSIIPLYKVDLSNSRNNLCKDNNSNITNDISTLKLSIPTLIKVKDGRIIENYHDYDTIKNVLFSYVD